MASTRKPIFFATAPICMARLLSEATPWSNVWSQVFVWMERGLFACAHRRAIKKQFALAGVLRLRGGTFEFRPGFSEAAELEEEVATNAGQKVIGLERRLGGQRVNEFETCGRTKGHCDRDGTVQFHDRRGRELCQGVVKSSDAVPVRFRGVRRASVACGDGRLQGVWPEGATKLFG